MGRGRGRPRGGRVIGDRAFELLHLLRIKGMAGTEVLAAASGYPLAEVEEEADRLAGEGLVEAREVGDERAWMLATQGLSRHEQLLASKRPKETAVSSGYEAFLELNRPAKSLVSSWQQGPPDPAAALGELEEIGEKAGEALRYAAREQPRFERYAERLELSLDRVLEGDERFVGDPGLDSFHTVWFECHEDFLLTLGLSREE